MIMVTTQRETEEKKMSILRQNEMQRNPHRKHGDCTMPGWAGSRGGYPDFTKKRNGRGEYITLKRLR